MKLLQNVSIYLNNILSRKEKIHLLNLNLLTILVEHSLLKNTLFLIIVSKQRTKNATRSNFKVLWSTCVNFVEIGQSLDAKKSVTKLCVFCEVSTTGPP